jgi:amino acid adenylation domain-containing protein
VTWLHSAFVAAARRTPDFPAIDGGREGLVTYEGLIRASLQLSKTIGSARSVGVLSNRRSEAYLAVVACFLSGRKFVPLNPAFPIDRLKRLTSLAEVETILCDAGQIEMAEKLGLPGLDVMQALSDISPDHDDAYAFTSPPAPDPDAIAYHLFTSGSTGEPKGVPIPYSAVSAYVETLSDRIAFPPGARYSQVFDLSFDLSIHDIFITLSQGGTMVPASDVNLLLPHSYVENRRIDVWFSVPTLAVAVIRGAATKPIRNRLKLALFCGEPLPMDTVKGFRDIVGEEAPIYNLYGPTEATIAFTVHKVSASDDGLANAPIGLAFGHNRVGLLVDDQIKETPAEGDEGELLLAGPQVFDGYAPHRETSCFVQHASHRYYRSGDVVRFRDGTFHHLDRIDDQVKIRGHRLELGEIETVFRDIFNLEHAVAVVVGQGELARICLAYEGQIEIEDTAQAAKRLPAYMMPASCLRFEKLPVNVNGKIDRKSLKEIEWPEQ